MLETMPMSFNGWMLNKLWNFHTMELWGFRWVWIPGAHVLKLHFLQLIRHMSFELFNQLEELTGKVSPSLTEYYSARKKNALLIHATTWMDLQNMMFSEKSQTQKSTYDSIYTKL